MTNQYQMGFYYTFYNTTTQNMQPSNATIDSVLTSSLV